MKKARGVPKLQETECALLEAEASRAQAPPLPSLFQRPARLSTVGGRSLPNRLLWSIALAVLMATGACVRDPHQAVQRHIAKGKGFMAKGKDREAIIEFRNALQVDPRSAEAFYQLALANEGLHQWNDVFVALRQAQEADPQRLDVKNELARLYLAAEKDQEAEDEASSVLQRDPGNATANQLLGAVAISRHDYEGALAPFTRLTGLLPNDPSSYINLGLLQIMLQRYPEAEASFKKAVAADAHSAAAYTNLAGFYRLRGRDAQAEQVLQQGMERNPDAATLYIAQADLLGLEGKKQQAESVVQALRTRQPGLADVAMSIGDLYFRQKQPDRALAEYQRGTSLDPKNDELRQRLLDLNIDLGRIPEADDLDRQILKQSPKDVPANIARGRILLAQGKNDEAITVLRQQVTQAPDAVLAHYFLAVAYRQNAQFQEAKSQLQETLRVRPDMPLAVHALADLNLNTGDLDVAQEYAERSVEKRPAEVAERLLLGSVLLRRGDLKRALDQFRLAQRIDPANPEVHLDLALAYAAGKRWPEADKEFAAATRLDPQSSDALALWCDSLVARKQSAKALGLVSQHVAAYPNEAHGHEVLGALDAELHQDGQAQAEFEKSIQLNPNLPGNYLRLGKIAEERGDLDGALRQYSAALAREPRFVPLITLIGNLCLKQGKLDAARKYYEQALAIDPNFGVADGNLAFVYTEQGGNLDVALGLAQKAKQLLPDMDSITDTLAWVHYKKGSYATAIPLFEECVRKAPDYPTYRYHLGLALLASGDKQHARESLETALRLKLGGQDAAEARDVLSKLN